MFTYLKNLFTKKSAVTKTTEWVSGDEYIHREDGPDEIYYREDGSVSYKVKDGKVTYFSKVDENGNYHAVEGSAV